MDGVSGAQGKTCICSRKEGSAFILNLLERVSVGLLWACCKQVGNGFLLRGATVAAAAGTEG